MVLQSHRKRGLSFLSVIGFALLLSSCTVGPDYVSPAPPAARQYTPGGNDIQGSVQRIVTGRTPESEWWRAFGSPDLDRIMNDALTGNNSLAAGRARLDQMREEVKAAAGVQWPQVSVDAEAGRHKYGVALFGPSDITIPPYTYYTVGPQVSYLLDFAGGERRRVERQEALAEEQAYRFKALQLTVAGNVMAQALGIAAADAQIAVLNDIVRDDRKNVDLVRIALKAGSGTMTDVLSAESQLADDLAQLPPLNRQLSVARHALAILTGRSPGEWQPPTFQLQALTLPHDLPLRLPSDLVRSRPDILAAESRLHAATAAIGVATADLYPHITLTANLVQQALTPGELFDASANTWAMAAGLTAPIFSGGTLEAKKRAAEDACRAALADYRQVVLTSFGQVADILKALEHDAEEIAAQENAVETAGASLELARLSFQAGNIGILQVLDAERLFNRARLGLARSTARRFQNTALLYLALGGGSPRQAEASARKQRASDTTKSSNSGSFGDPASSR